MPKTATAEQKEGTINRLWFKNQMRKGNFLVKCNGKYTDDYAWDNDNKFFEDKDFKECKPDLLNDWYISCCHIYGTKTGIIKVSFAMCEWWEFKVKQA